MLEEGLINHPVVGFGELGRKVNELRNLFRKIEESEVLCLLWKFLWLIIDLWPLYKVSIKWRFILMYYLLVLATICGGGSTYRMPKIIERSCYFSLWKACSGWSYWRGLSLGWWLPPECHIVWENAWQCFWHLGRGKTYRGQYFKSLFAIFRCLIIPLAEIFVSHFLL